MLVRHEPNLSSGGQSSDVPIPKFLSRSATSPQAEALQALLKMKCEADTEDE